ncbi:hypothetical protein [Superficieibacter sp. 1612_C1]|uniref:hypothetical protein n=1 Tax=unclassified Superficieibacter TaxID=2645744 RepID=UPI0018847587|nr:hypothetical protein [Superficieibacter sp. 1612_C1]
MRLSLMFIPFSVFTLSGCVVADMDSSNYDFPPYIQTFQKQGQLGHTDTVQRKNDLYACGLDRNTDPDSKLWRRNVALEGETMEQEDRRIASLEACMKNKGYVLLDPGRCGPLKAPTGMCN